MVFGGGDVHAEVARTVEFGDLLDVGGAGSRDQGLALHVVKLGDVRRLLGDQAVGGDESGRRERHLFLAVQVVGGRAALQINRAIGHQWNARGGGDRVEIDFQIRHFELGLDGIGDLHADVHRVADRLLLVVEVGERD